MGDMSYSLDLRKKVLEALEAESSSNMVAARFGVSGSFVRKLRARVRETGEPGAIPPPGKARIVDSKGEAIMRDLVDDRPDATLGKLASLFRRHGGRKISETTTWRTLRRMGLSLKKRPSTQRNAIDPMLSSPGKNSKSKARSGTLPG